MGYLVPNVVRDVMLNLCSICFDKIVATIANEEPFRSFYVTVVRISYIDRFAHPNILPSIIVQYSSRHNHPTRNGMEWLGSERERERERERKEKCGYIKR
jgi:hypothetical protein